MGVRGPAMLITQMTNRPWAVATMMILSWLGMTIHNQVELPSLTWYRAEYVLPTLVSLLLFAGWWRQPNNRRIWAWAILAWSALHFIVGGFLSVLPLPIWPFSPEQNLRHYLAHLIYLLLQIPIILFASRQILGLPIKNDN